MPTVQQFQNNFTSGEISPSLNARSDVKQYTNGLRLCRDAIPSLEGDIDGRPGSQYICSLAAEFEQGKLIDFIVSNDESYVVILNAERFRFITDRALIPASTITISAIVDNGSGLMRVTATGHGFVTGQQVMIRDVVGTYEANTTWIVTVIDVNTIDLNTSSFTNTYTSGGVVESILELTTVYTESDFPTLRWAQDVDNLYIVDGNHRPTILSRIGPLNFTRTTFFPNGPYNERNTTATTLTFSGAVIAGATGTLTSTGSIFSATDEDRVVSMGGKLPATDVRGYLKITAYTNTTTVDATVVGELDSAAATTDWALGAWNDVDGWPRAVTFHEQRLLFAGTAKDPNRWWGSFLNVPDDFVADTPANNDDSYSYTVASTKTNIIKWIESLDSLLIGTQGEELLVTGPSGTTIGPTAAPLIKPQTKRGSSDTAPLVIDDVVMFLQWGGRRLYALEFDEDRNTERFSTQDLTFIGRHLVPNGTTITRLTYEEQPNNIVWATRSDGKMLSMVFFPEQEVLGWSLHNTQNGLFEDVLSIPSYSRGINETYFIVKRVINGATRGFIELFNRDLQVDSGLLGTFGSPQTLVDSLHHLAFESVAVQIDGAAGEPTSVNFGGQINLDAQGQEGTIVQAGLPFEPTMQLLEPAQETGTISTTQSMGRLKKYGAVFIRTRDTLALAFNDRIQPSRAASDVMDTVPPTAELRDWVPTDIGHKTINSLKVSQPLPLPFHVLSVGGTVSIGEK